MQAKGGSAEITVRRCRFENAGGRAVNIGGSTGPAYFRPKPQGFEAKDVTVEDCTFVGSAAPIAFVGVDGAVVRHNTLYHPTRWVMRILQENRGDGFIACRNGTFTRNIVVFASRGVTAVNIGPATAPETFHFTENYWHCPDRPEGTRRAVRLPVPEENGTYGRAPGFRDADGGDLTLTAGSPAQGFGPRAGEGSR